MGRKFAVLIGASEYKGTIPPLRGPRNDVMQIWRLLRDRDFPANQIQLLADGLPETFARQANNECNHTLVGKGCPTSTSIVAAFERLLRQVKPGDFVYLHMSGHGVQVPDLVNPDEDDGVDEAFVPLDVKGWDPDTQTVPNLITDDMVRDLVRSLRAKQVFVWAVFDICHSGTMLRGSGNQARLRRLRRSDLNIPEHAFVRARQLGTSFQSAQTEFDPAPFDFKLGDRGQNGFVAFYAAQAGQLALEMPFSDRGRKRSFGAMTYALSRALARNRAVSYQQIAQSIVDQYASLGADMPAPYFEGDLRDGIFGGDLSPSAAYAVKLVGDSINIASGRLHGIDEGALMQFEDVSRKRPVALGRGRVVEADLFSSRVVAGRQIVRTVERLGHRVRARLSLPSLRFRLRVSALPRSDRSISSSAALVIRKARRRTRKTPSKHIQWVRSDAMADVYLRATNDRLWLLSAFGSWRRDGSRKSISLSLEGSADTAAARLNDLLWRIARARNLRKVVSAVRRTFETSMTAGSDGFRAEAFVLKASSSHGDKHKCRNVPLTQIPPRARPLPTSNVANLKHCDVIYFELSNTGSDPIDVTMLHLDSQAGITAFQPGGSARILGSRAGIGRKRIVPILVVTRDQVTGKLLSSGREQLVFIAVTRERDAPSPITFNHLAQPNLSSAGSALSSASRSLLAEPGVAKFSALLNAANLVSKTSGVSRSLSIDNLSRVRVQMFEWNVKSDNAQ